MIKILKEKFIEAFIAIIPVALIIIVICAFLVPVSLEVFLMFFIGVILLIIGMAIFSIGADQSMITMGNKIGTKLSQSKSVWIIALVSLLLGIIVTLTEPDLQILASQVSSINNIVFIVTVSVGVGFFLLIAMLRILFHIPLNYILSFFYLSAIVLCFFIPSSFQPVAFDAGGVTTGPMTVPFMLSIGLGVCSVRGGKSSVEDSFGILGIASSGPIIAILVLGMFYKLSGTDYIVSEIIEVKDSLELFNEFWNGMFENVVEVFMALIPIIIFFFIFQFFTKAFSRFNVYKILIGLFIIFIGLVIFLTGANVGFLHIGYELGAKLSSKNIVLFVFIGIVIGFFLVQVEPAVHVLTKQVEKVTIGAISSKQMLIGLSIGVSLAIGISILRVVYQIPLIYILVPGYLLAAILTFFIPKMITGIAFDSGGVASGTMVSAFILPLMIGAAITLKVEVMTYAFGCVALVALAPIISVEVSGLIYAKKAKKAKSRINLDEDEIIDYY